ncbi:MAG: DUF86 domain-containing protein [Bacilli bacterium]|nr:DUF86 domain-containing protein [Bacilli bacterium]
MNKKDEQIIYHINNHYQEFKLIKNYEDFVSNNIIKKAIILDLIQIGYNVNKLSFEFQKQINKINLRGVVGIRNHLVHGYGTIDDKIVWTAIKENLPDFIFEINNINLK